MTRPLHAQQKWVLCLNTCLSYSLGSDCSTEAEHMDLDWEVVGLNPAGCWFFTLLYPIFGMSLIRSLTVEQHFWFSYKICLYYLSLCNTRPHRWCFKGIISRTREWTYPKHCKSRFEKQLFEKVPRSKKRTFCKIATKSKSNRPTKICQKVHLINFNFEQLVFWAVVAAQLAERSLLTPKIRGSNPNISKNYMSIV